MQEEMNEKTVSLIIRGTKVTAVVLKDAMKMFLRQTSNKVSKSGDAKQSVYQKRGRISVL